MQKSMLILVTMVLFLSGASRASDCCLKFVLPILEGVSSITLEDAAERFRSIDPNFTYLLTGSRVCRTNPRVSESESYCLTFLGHSIPSIEVGNDQFKGNRLLAYLPITKLSPDRFVAVEEASMALREDIEEISITLGLHFYIPAARPIHQRCPLNTWQLLFMGMEAFGERASINSNKSMTEDFKVKISEFVPERDNYSDDSIYQKGDLQITFLSDLVLFKKCQKQAMDNVTNISASLSLGKSYSISQEALEKWQQIVLNFERLDPSKL